MNKQANYLKVTIHIQDLNYFKDLLEVYIEISVLIAFYHKHSTTALPSFESSSL